VSCWKAKTRNKSVHLQGNLVRSMIPIVAIDVLRKLDPLNRSNQPNFSSPVPLIRASSRMLSSMASTSSSHSPSFTYDAGLTSLRTATASSRRPLNKSHRGEGGMKYKPQRIITGGTSWIDTGCATFKKSPKTQS